MWLNNNKCKIWYCSWKKSYDKPRQRIKKQRHPFPKICIVKALFLPVVACGCGEIYSHRNFQDYNTVLLNTVHRELNAQNLFILFLEVCILWPTSISLNHQSLENTILLCFCMCLFPFNYTYKWKWGFPGGANGIKNPPANAGDIGDLDSIPGWGRSLGGGMATHCSILPGESPWTEEPGRLQSIGS